MDNTEELSAYHEAGHAVMAVSMGATIQSVSISPDGDGPDRYGDATVKWPLDRFPERELRRRMVLVALAGPVAEMLYRGEPLHPGFVPEWKADWREAWEVAAPIVADEKKRLAHLEQLIRELHQLLDSAPYWSALAAVADHLMAYDMLEQEQIEEIVAAWLA